MVNLNLFSIERLGEKWSFLLEPIEESCGTRKVKVSGLSIEETREISDLEKNLSTLEQIFEEFIQKKRLSYSHSSDEDEGFNFKKGSLSFQTKEAVAEQVKMETIINSFSKYPFISSFDRAYYNINNDWQEETACAYFIIYKETVLNCLVNKMVYFNEIKNSFEKNKEDIISIIFQKNKECVLKENYVIVDGGISYISQNAETHNGGKKAVFIKIKDKNNIEYELVCKPRNAKIDELVIELFSKINELDKKNVQLKTYAIFNTEDMSFWQKLEGKDLAELGCPDSQSPLDFISAKIEDIAKKENLANKIKKMAAICSQLDISDLHGGNAMLVDGGLEVHTQKEDRYREQKKFKVLNLEKVDIALIDLEVKHRCYPTLLLNIPNDNANSNKIKTFKDRELGFEFKPGEIELISDYNKKIKEECSYRILLASTGALRNVSRIYDKNILENAKTMIRNGIKNQDYAISGDIKLRRLLMKDTLNGDIAFFTEENETLFYGNKQSGIVLAKKILK